MTTLGRPLIALAAGAAAVALALAGCATEPRGGAERLPGPVPDGVVFTPASDAPNAPAVQGELLDGTPITGEQLWDGRPAVLQFATSWCTRCAEQQPVLDELADRYGDAVTIALVSGDPADGVEELRAFLDAHDVEQPVVLDPELRVWRSYAVAEAPMTALVDADGRLVKLWPGGADAAKLGDALEALVELPGN